MKKSGFFGGRSTSLHERVRTGLVQEFKGSLSEDPMGLSNADLLIQQGGRVAVVEVKTGDPELPLPSSTTAQMVLLEAAGAAEVPRGRSPGSSPVLITNYNVSPNDEKELEGQGIKVLRIGPADSYDAGKFSRQVASLIGLQTDLV